MLITRVDIGEPLRHQFHREKIIKFTIHFITYTHHETTCHIFQVRNLFHMHQACTRQYPAFLYKNGFGMHRAGGLPYRRCLKCYHVTLLLRKLPVHVSKAHTKYITRCKPVRFPVHVMTWGITWATGCSAWHLQICRSGRHLIRYQQQRLLFSMASSNL